MKVLIAGSRTISDKQYVYDAIDSLDIVITEIISGGAQGVDTIGEQYASDNNIPVKRFFPDWTKFGKSAGVLRNKEMVNCADIVVVVWDGLSRGTQSTMKFAEDAGKPLYIF